MGGVGKLEEEVTEVKSSSEMVANWEQSRCRVLGCVWTPVCKTLFPERVKAVNDPAVDEALFSRGRQVQGSACRSGGCQKVTLRLRLFEKAIEQLSGISKCPLR